MSRDSGGHAAIPLEYDHSDEEDVDHYLEEDQREEVLHDGERGLYYHRGLEAVQCENSEAQGKVLLPVVGKQGGIQVNSLRTVRLQLQGLYTKGPWSVRALGQVLL